MVIKIITVKITENNSDKYEYVEFPVNRYGLNDKLDRAGIFGEYTVKISELANETGLKNINLSDEPTVDELNFLAKKLEEVCTDKYKALAYSAVISQHESVSIAEAINCTYGLENVLIYPCNSAAEYGEIVLENELFEEAKDISDEIYELLDREKVGKIMQEREGGIFKDGYYIIPSSYEPQLVYDDVLPEAMDGWLFKLEATVMDGDDPDEDILETLTLPASEERISELEDKFGKPASEWVWLSFKSGLCALDSEAMQNADDVEQLNEFASAVSEMSRSELVKFKAVLEKEQPESVAEATDIFMSLDDYEFDPTVINFEDYAEKYLSEMLPPDFDRTVLSDGLNAYLGRNISEKNGSQLTEYGMLSSAGGQIYSMIEAEQPRQGQMMSL